MYKVHIRRLTSWSSIIIIIIIINFFKVSICSHTLVLLEHCLCELVYYFVLQDLICLMFLLLLKRPTADTFSLTLTLSYTVMIVYIVRAVIAQW